MHIYIIYIFMYFTNSRILDICKYTCLSNNSELNVQEMYNLYSNYGSTIISTTKFNILQNISEKPIYVENKSLCNTSCFIYKELIINETYQNNIIVAFNDDNLCSIKDYNYNKSVFKFPYENNNFFNIYPKVCDLYNKNFEYIKDNLSLYLDKYIEDNFFNESNNITNLNDNDNENNILLNTDILNNNSNNNSNNSNNSNNNNDDNLLSYNIIFCGHNTGGAYAQIAALYYKLLYPNINIYCLSFGSPRIGNKKFINLFQKYINEYLRVEYINDIIPLKHSSFTYYHHNNVLYIGNDNDYILKHKYLIKFKNLFFSMLNISNINSKFMQPYINYTINDYLNYFTHL